MNRNITALILIVLSVGIYYTVTDGVWQSTKSIKAVNDQYSGAIENAKRLISVRDEVRDKYNGISAIDQSNLKKMLPSTVDNIRLIIDLSNIGLQHGFSLKNITADAAKGSQSNQAPSNSNTIPAPTLDTVQVSFSVTAPYQQFISFMQDLESNLRVMDITSLSVSAADNGIYDFSVKLNTYWLRQ